MKILRDNKPFRFSPTQILSLGFVVIILVGTLLLSLPISTSKGTSISLIDALFQATSAICVTGLTVVNTAQDLSIFGQIITIILIQIGGLGFMTMATTVFLVAGKRITLRERLIMQEALNHFTIQGVVRLTKNILATTLILEGAGAVLLAFRFIPMFGWIKGIYFSIFHSISAFCNAGFDLMGNSLLDFSGDIIINFTIMALIILGGLGFSVIRDVYNHRYHFRKWHLHTKLVVLSTIILLLSGFLFFFIMEYDNVLANFSLKDKIIASLFHSVTIRTAGFYSTPMEEITEASKFFTIILMFIGASPASTGGGIKTVTAMVIILTVKSVIEGKDDIEIFRRRIPYAIANRALAITVISLGFLVFVTIIFSIVEPYPFIDLLFQTSSALGTVGVASFDNSMLSNISKLLTILCMYTGRVGPLTLTLAFAKRQSSNNNLIKYPEDQIMVG
mgnify:FL=1